MRQDFLREQFQVLQVVKHRVQEQVARPSTHEVGQLLRTFRRTPPDAALGAHVSTAVAYAEPLTQATLSAAAVVINGEIDALRNREGRWITLRLVQEMLQQ